MIINTSLDIFVSSLFKNNSRDLKLQRPAIREKTQDLLLQSVKLVKMTNQSETDHTSSAGDNSHLETVVIINCALNVPLMLIAIIGNTLVLSSIWKTPSLRSPSTVFLSSLAVSDLLVGLVVQPVYIANELTNDSLYTLRNTTAFSALRLSALSFVSFFQHFATFVFIP